MEQRISFLLQKRIQQRLTAAESEELLAILQNAEYEEVVTDLLQQMAVSQEQGPAMDPAAVRQWVHAIVAVDKGGHGVVAMDEDGRGGMAKDKAVVRTVKLQRMVWYR